MVRKRRAWEDLSDGYRARLSRSGVTKRSYESGVDLSGARGHAKTPEHPADYVKNPKRYKEYGETRKGLIAKVKRRKDGLFSDRFKYNKERSMSFVMNGTEKGSPPTLAQLRWFLNATDEEIEDNIPREETEDSWMWYH